MSLKGYERASVKAIRKKYFKDFTDQSIKWLLIKYGLTCYGDKHLYNVKNAVETISRHLGELKRRDEEEKRMIVKKQCKQVPTPKPEEVEYDDDMPEANMEYMSDKMIRDQQFESKLDKCVAQLLHNFTKKSLLR